MIAAVKATILKIVIIYILIIILVITYILVIIYILKIVIIFFYTEDSAHHNCQAQNCPACKKSKSKDKDGSQDFKLWAKPDRGCIRCRREDCFVYHLVQHETENPALKRAKQKWEKEYREELPSIVELKSVCDQFRKCKDCLVSYKVNEELEHKCLHAMRKHCPEYVNIY